MERIDAREPCIHLRRSALPRRPDRTKTLIRCGSPRREFTTHGAYALARSNLHGVRIDGEALPGGPRKRAIMRGNRSQEHSLLAMQS